ncbi:hypothetical protein GALL_428230 [mine drainage metagenome]|uniref:Uncharacterized protein n=1 Tax=mine drainage metagenome TaxID=410659 RepID=A0A1J5Q691_9ZZZZ
MDFSSFLTAPPWLPEPQLMRWAWHLSWALVLAAGVVWMGRPQVRWPLALMALLWTLFAGALSPAHWLGLAFQSPSLTSVGLCLLWLVRQWPSRRLAASRAAKPGASASLAWLVLSGAGLMLGGLLLGDLLAWWPVSVYAWGFGTPALLLACSLTLVFWLVFGSGTAGQQATGVIAAVLVVFTVTRLPSGNLWDAVLDPWLWMSLQVAALVRLWRWGSARFRAGRV